MENSEPQYYQHKCQDGTLISMIVIFLDGLVMTKSIPKIIPVIYSEEYKMWREKIVNPDIYSKLTKEEILELQLNGFEDYTDILTG